MINEKLLLMRIWLKEININNNEINKKTKSYSFKSLILSIQYIFSILTYMYRKMRENGKYLFKDCYISVQIKTNIISK